MGGMPLETLGGKLGRNLTEKMTGKIDSHQVKFKKNKEIVCQKLTLQLSVVCQELRKVPINKPSLEKKGFGTKSGK